MTQARDAGLPAEAGAARFSIMDLNTAYGTGDAFGRDAAEERANLARLRKAALAYRSGLMAEGRAELDSIYGHHPHHAYDLFWPERDEGHAVVLFVHGGYWRLQARDLFSHLAAGLLALGVPVVIMGMRACPEADIPALIGDARQMTAHLSRRLMRPIVVVGHGSGAHLAACLVATDWKARGFSSDVVRAGMGISGIYDLRPLLGTHLKETLRLDEMTAHAASPLLWPIPERRRFLVCVGERETGPWRRQSETLAEVWQAGGMDTGLAEIAAADHLTVLDSLRAPSGALTEAVRALCHAASDRR